MSVDSVSSFSSMLRQSLGAAIIPSAETFVEMFAENGVMQFPYSPPGLTGRLEGRDAVAAHLDALSGVVAFDRMTSPKIHKTEDTGIFVLEFMGFGRSLHTDEPYEQTYISVIEVRDGYIVNYRDYWNPLIVLKVMGDDMQSVSASGNQVHA